MAIIPGPLRMEEVMTKAVRVTKSLCIMHIIPHAISIYWLGE